MKCKDCESHYGPPFIWMTDGDWKKIGCNQEDFLCFVCIAKRVMERNNGAWVWHLTCGEGKHELKRCKTTVEVKTL